ncbi:MAG: hypothetical protein H6662_13045 [Ardenticatenaceae bacterium]|nr:hypothetical protein [Anaerolineales bacterium]MCB8922505.1 hypothetical protein [Ardenticatenaceae bacterium]MCB8989974.1 hypothetical protein [Ardenticatenaceae bacterium]MCB9005417.1 hypothetical protein [Ardenticatenaceae bacterium]
MIELKHPRQIRVWEPVVMFVAIAVLIVYAINVLNTEDWLWFRAQTIDATPNRIVLMVNGERVLIQPGHAEYQALATAVQTALQDFSNTDLINIDFNEESLTYYDNKGVLLELYYDNPINFHAAFRVGKPTQILIPIEGRHAGYDYFFRGDKGIWWFGAMRMADSLPLFQTLAELGYIK